jgi:hypothetical protein
MLFVRSSKRRAVPGLQFSHALLCAAQSASMLYSALIKPERRTMNHKTDHRAARAPHSAPLRVRHEPATIDEAVLAARDLTSDIEQQVEITAGLIGMPSDEVREYVLRRPAEPREDVGSRPDRVRVVVVERRGARPRITSRAV